MADYTELCEHLRRFAGYFERIDEHFIRARHWNHLTGKGPQVGQVLNLVSEKLPASTVLRENVNSKKLYKWIENWAQLYRISNISLEIEQFVAENDELKETHNSNAVNFVQERLSDVDLVVASMSAKQLDAGDCLKKIIHQDTALDAAVKECKVFNYLVDWVEVDVGGCHRKLQLASDRIVACGKNSGFPILQWLCFALSIPGIIVSAFFPDWLDHPIIVFIVSLGLQVIPIRSYFKVKKYGGQDSMPSSILAKIKDPLVITDILNLAANLEIE